MLGTRIIKGVEMMPQKQTILGHINGNCYAACLATILCMDIKNIPNFYSEDYTCERTPDEVQANIREWLYSYGVDILRLSYHPSLMAWVKDTAIPIIVTGVSPRHKKYNHAVVYLGDEMVFDPSPGPGEGVLEIVDLEFFLCLKPFEQRRKTWLRDMELLVAGEPGSANRPGAKRSRS